MASLPRTPLLRDDGTSFGEFGLFLNPTALFIVLFATETSSQDSGEFSMSTDNDLSLTDFEGNLQPSQVCLFSFCNIVDEILDCFQMFR